jgi:PAS domain-containing protein
MAATGKPDIRGERRSELIWDLAQGSLTHAELATKYDRHVQAIAQFAVRNRGEIAVVQAGNNRALHERLAEIPIADKARRIAVDQVLRDDLLSRLEDSDLDARLRNHYTKTIMALQRAVAEEMGDLRTTVDLTTTKGSLTDFDEVILDENGQFHAVAGTQHHESSG